MGKNKDIDSFIRDAKGAGKIVGSHIPVVKHAIEAHEIHKTTDRLRKSTPKAIEAAKREVSKRIKKKRQGLTRNIKKRFRLR